MKAETLLNLIQDIEDASLEETRRRRRSRTKITMKKGKSQRRFTLGGIRGGNKFGSSRTYRREVQKRAKSSKSGSWVGVPGHSSGSNVGR